MRTGIRRKVDDLGRVVIPAGIRRSLGMREGETVEVAVEGEQVILFKPVDQCVFCGGEEGLRPFRNKSVCRSCIAAVGVLDDSLREPPPARGAESGDAGGLPPWRVGDNGNARTEPAERAAPRQSDTTPAPGERKWDVPPAPERESAPAAEESGAAPGEGSRTGRDDPYEPPASTTAW